jgi:predicted membrane channel-forming protein YqfA (hemolysin III family)
MIVMEIVWQDYAWLRIVNLIAAVAAMGVMGISFGLKRSQTPRRYRRLAVCIYMLMGVVAYASGRAYSMKAPVAEHVALITVALFTFIAAIAWHPKGDDALPGPEDTAIPARAHRAFTYYWIRTRDAIVQWYRRSDTRTTR